ncbi:MAG: hypothetical protein EA001_12460 [Oscillatoriales cyanobacterium]|nr:MAG: hypothetical protein EA001_12460 [Oscillatoriales cyanobacterium]
MLDRRPILHLSGSDRWRRSRWGLVLASLVALAINIPAGESVTPKTINCDRLPHWSNFASGSQVNQHHIFCGELDNGRPKGFHSRPGGSNPSSIARSRIEDQPNSRGIYSIRWRHRDDRSREKFSTMFPDRCSQAQVTESIRYAAANRVSCPAGAPDWAWCGYNYPGNNRLGTGDSNRFCQANDGQRFVIAGALIRGRNRVNTAFPLR